MRFLTLSFCTLLLAACGDGPTAPAPAPSVAGDWTMTFTLSGTFTDPDVGVLNIACSGNAPLTLADAKGEVDGAFDIGDVTCTFGEDTFEADWSSEVTGTRVKSDVTLNDGLCDYSGTLAKEAITNGKATCAYDDGVSTLAMTGTWQMTK